MKKLILIILFFTSIIFAHRQHVHQYITIEAYNLLKLSIGYDIPTLQSRIGGTSSWYIGDRPWQRGYITTGAWREDEEDIVYGYSKSSPPTLTGIAGSIYSFISIFGGLTPDGFVSSTHFWYADDGDELSTTIRAGVTFLGTQVVSFTVPNAYQKFMKFSNPNRSWTLKYYDGNTAHQSTFTKAGGGTITITWYDYLGFQYNSLKDLYLTGRAWIVGYYNSLGQWINCDYEIVLGQGWRDAFTWELLGRMCHLLQDMSVPAHANIDPHGDDPALIEDYYESYFGYDFYWNAQNIYSQIGGMINPYLYQPSNPLHFLMYTTNQMSNHFSTQGPHKKFNNDYFSGNGTSAEIAYLNSLNVSQFGIPTTDNGPWNNDAIINVRNKMLPQAIRATAGLLYWFAKECDILYAPVVAPIIANFTQSPNPLYRGNSGSVTCNLSQGNGSLNFNWSIVSGNTGFSISNTNSQTVSLHYSSTDAIEKSITENISSPKETPIEGPTGAVLKCKVWNSAGNDSANVFINLATTPHGCPFVYTWNGETWVEDNNILPQSQDSTILGQDVTDFYQLYTKPILDEGKYYLAVGEFEEEISYLDQLKLLVVDHPQETFITVDDNGEIIQFAKPAYFANAQLDSIDVYKKLIGLDSIKAEVSIDDTLSLSFEDVSVGTEKWLLVIGQQQPIYKDKISGSILGGVKENTAEFSSFRLRKNPTYQWILVPDGNSSSLQVDIAFQSEAEIDYTELSHKLELPFTVYTPQLLYAEHSTFGDVTSLLNQIDEQYSILNTDEMITLEYSAPPINEGMERTFIFVSSGRYERLENRMLAKGKSDIANKYQLTSNTENSNIVYEYGLGQNYPNPFNPVTTISYQIKEQGLVQLKVYNLLGQEIVTLVNDVQSSGIYESLFDASNLPSGVYIYSLRVNDFVQNNKMTLLK